MLLESEKLVHTPLRGPTTWKDMRRNIAKLANKTIEQLHKVSTPCLDDTEYKKEELDTVGEWTKVCSQIVLKCLYLARMGRLDFLWSVNNLARAVTKWTRARDKRLARLISYVHYTNDGRACRITQPNLQYNSGRGERQESRIHYRDGHRRTIYAV